MEKLQYFFRFLKNNNYYGQFMHNCYTLPPYASSSSRLDIGNSDILDRLIKYSTFKEIIMNAFQWDKTIEGDDFWCQVWHEAPNAIVNSIIQKNN